MPALSVVCRAAAASLLLVASNGGQARHPGWSMAGSGT